MNIHDRALLVAAALVIASSGCGSDSGRQNLAQSSGGADAGGPSNGAGNSGTPGRAGTAGMAGTAGTASSAGGSGNTDVDASRGGGGVTGSGGAPGTGGSSGSNPDNHGGTAGSEQDAGAGVDAGGGGDDGDPSASVVSGTRLKAKFVTSGDGAKTYRRGILYDSKLQVDCAYATAADGKNRCLPTGSFIVSAPILYADADCTQLVIWMSPTGAVGCPWNPPPYAMTGQTSGHCTQQFQQQIYPIEGTIIDNAGTFQKNGTKCTGVGVSYPGAVAVLLKAEVAPTEFVEGTPAVAP